MATEVPVKYRRHPKLWYRTQLSKEGMLCENKTTKLPYLVDIMPGVDCVNNLEKSNELCRELTREYRTSKAKMPKPPSLSMEYHSIGRELEKFKSVRKFKKQQQNSTKRSRDRIIHEPGVRIDGKIYSQQIMTPLECWKRQLTVQPPEWYLEISETIVDKLCHLKTKKKSISELYGLRTLFDTEGSLNGNSLCLLNGLINKTIRDS